MVLKRGQVYLATHDGEGNSLSNAQRSFISFTWGGRKIEDFGFIATIDGDRLSRNLYSEFEDLTTEYDIIDGQIFWGSKYNPLTLSFTLSTDGVKEPTLQDFRNWFKAGITRELILSESPNRAIQARVSVAPSFSLLPFEEREEVQIGNNTYQTRTTLWKGDLSLSFIMEDPFWYNIKSIFSSEDELTEDDIKIILEDGVPHIDMFNNFSSNNADVCFLANNQILSGGTIQENTGISLVADQPQYIYYCGTGKGKPTLQFTCVSTFDSNDYINFPHNSYIESEDLSYNTISLVKKDDLSSPEVEEENNIESDIGTLVSPSNNTNNETNTDNESTHNETDSSTDTSEPSTDSNDDTSTDDSTDPTNNSQESDDTDVEDTPETATEEKVVTFESVFKFTTPGILSSYNQVIKIISNDYKAGDSIIEMRSAIRDTVSDFYVRSFAMGLCDLALNDKLSGICDSNSALVDGFKSVLIANLKKIFLGASNATTVSADYLFNSLTGQATMSLPIYLLDLNSNTQTQGSVSLATEAITIKENIGDMARSNYLIIDSRTLPKDGKITTTECLEISSDCNLSNVKLIYNYMYL